MSLAKLDQIIAVHLSTADDFPDEAIKYQSGFPAIDGDGVGPHSESI